MLAVTFPVEVTVPIFCLNEQVAELVELVRDVDIKLPDIALALSPVALVIWSLVFTPILYVIDHLFLSVLDIL
ncbi:hypothetical protein CMALT394_560003 [Carnobacterium maltaromaticum]|nr:hypothetical protein CMALT394_560003 [Carnobacterium maltaromaticum]